MRQAVVGAGHVGLVAAACLAEQGSEVVAIDFPERIAALERGALGFSEPELAERLARARSTGRLTFSASIADSAGSDVVWIAVPTHGARRGLYADDVESVVEQLGDHAQELSIIAVKSTLPLGATRRIAGRVPSCADMLLYVPEFLRQGTAVRDFTMPSKIVVGGPTNSAKRLLDILRPSCLTFVTNWDTAEMAKLAHNSYNALRISFMNSITMVSSGHDVSVDTVSRTLSKDHALHSRYLAPGLSYGGRCLPHAVDYLDGLEQARPYDTGLFHAIAQVNRERVRHLADQLSDALGGLRGRHVSLWGISYKAGSDDLANSATLMLARALALQGASVSMLDPEISSDAIVSLGYLPAKSAEDALRDADAVIVLTRSRDFASVPGELLALAARRCVIVDVVRALPQWPPGESGVRPRESADNTDRASEHAGSMSQVQLTAGSVRPARGD